VNKTGTWKQETPLQYCCASRGPVALLLADPRVDVNKGDCNGDGPIAALAKSDESDYLVEMLLASGKKIDVTSIYKKNFCNRVSGSGNDLIKSVESEPGFQALLTGSPLLINPDLARIFGKNFCHFVILSLLLCAVTVCWVLLSCSLLPYPIDWFLDSLLLQTCKKDPSWFRHAFFLSSFLPSFFALCLGGLVKGRNSEQQPFSSNTLENNNRKSVSEPLVNGTGILALEQVRGLLSGIVLRPRPPPIVDGNADHSNQNHCRNRDNHVKTSTGNASLCQKRERGGGGVQ